MAAPTKQATRQSALDTMVRRADSGEDGLARSLGPFQLTAIGVAAVVGAGIFVVTGQAAADHAGPAVAISFVIAGFAAALSALCYAELASMIPLAGSTYSYAYAALGIVTAWIIGWDLLLEYLFGVATVASAWSGYFVNLLDQAGIHLPHALVNPPVAPQDGTAGLINVPAMILLAGAAGLLILGVRESARVTTGLVGVKVGVLILFIAVGFFYIKGANYEPFVPPNTGHFGAFGVSGIVAAAGLTFYSFIGFDAVCTAAQEARDPRRTVPLGVLGCLGVATGLYVLVGIVMVGLVPFHTLDTPDPLSTAVEGASIGGLGSVIDIGATIGLGASVLALFYGQTRILMRMAQDGMLPHLFSKVDGERKTPRWSTIICGAVAMAMAGSLPVDILVQLISIGTLLAFVIVSSAVLVLRHTRPDLERPFRVPWSPFLPILAIVTALGVMATLSLTTWLRLVVWLVIGLTIFFTYSRSRATRIADERAAEASGHAG